MQLIDSFSGAFTSPRIALYKSVYHIYIY